MKAHKGKFEGIKKVYSFTLQQMLKGKSSLITLVFLIFMAAASVPVMTLIMGGEKSGDSDITAVYIQNDTGYQINFQEIPEKNPMFQNTAFAETEMTEDTYGETLGDSEVFIHLKRDIQADTFTVTAFTQEVTDFSESELTDCAKALAETLEEARYSQLNARPEQMDLLMSGYDVEVQSEEEYFSEEEDNFDARFGVQMVYSIIAIMLCSFSSAYIVRSVIEEKASKLAELLMVSVRPFAMLTGKILAVMTYVAILLAGCAGAWGLSYVITGKFMDTSVIQKQAEGMGITADVFRISPATAGILLISLLLGYLFFSLLSGFFGSGCSEMEDVESANLSVILIVMAGYLVATITAPMQSSVLAAAVSLFPVTSVFCAPVRYMIGDIGLGTLFLSWMIQIIAIGCLVYVCGRVYQNLILYRGSRMKFGAMIAAMKKSKTREAR
ncbi:MAG: ABC transporter permease [Eubacteriales bacterium]|nr:ABC transporter permease [Eubacteriales bacterium]